MKVSIDFSVFTPSGAFGMISGALELAQVPGIGEKVAFSPAMTGVLIPLTAGFNWLIEVEDVLHPANGDGVAVSLADVSFESVADAQVAMKYFESGFGLHADYWSDSLPTAEATSDS